MLVVEVLKSVHGGRRRRRQSAHHPGGFLYVSLSLLTAPQNSCTAADRVTGMCACETKASAVAYVAAADFAGAVVDADAVVDAAADASSAAAIAADDSADVATRADLPPAVPADETAVIGCTTVGWGLQGERTASTAVVAAVAVAATTLPTSKRTRSAATVPIASQSPP